MACALNAAHDVVHQAHAILGAGVEGSHLPVKEARPRAGDGMPCLPQADLQEGVPPYTPQSLPISFVCDDWHL